MNVDRFPIEAGHVLAFRRACGDPAAEAGAETAGQQLAPPTGVGLTGWAAARLDG